MSESIRIVVPSRNRVANMARIQSLLPSALICVHQDEAAQYKAVVPADRLLTHDAQPGLPAVRNWINAHVQEDVIVMIDDDFRYVKALTGTRAARRKITDPRRILEICQNTARVAGDLEIGAFCWSRTENKVLIEPRLTPIRFVAMLGTAFGIRGPARERIFDESLLVRADIDFTLRCLLEDRVLYCDARFIFGAGRIFGGAGGNAGLVGPKDYQHSTAELSRRWGKFVSTSAAGGADLLRAGPPVVRSQETGPMADADRDGDPGDVPRQEEP